MYVPEHFVEDRRDVLIDAITNIQFGMLVSAIEGELSISHVPMIVRHLDADIWLETHVARANDHWQNIENAGSTVAVFQGPQAYISPSFYPSKAQHGKVVPTWTYIAVHAHGKLQTMPDDGSLRRHLIDLTNANEKSREVPWQVSDAPEKYLTALSRGIVGLRLKVDRLEGKWKINQNKSDQDIEGTRQGLQGSGNDGQALAQALSERLGKAEKL